MRSVDAYGKHLFLRFEGGLTIHSHLRMTGSWRVFDRGAQWHRSPRSAWLRVRRGEREVLQFNGPVLELMTDSRTRLDRRIAGLGPDILAPELDTARVLRRLREDDPTRTIGDALLDQRTIAGIGNLWKVEGCFAAGIDPWRPAGEVSDEEVLAILAETRPRMQRVGGRRHPGPLQGRLRQGRAARARAAGGGTDLARAGARPGRRQPPDLLVPGHARREADRPQGRRPHRARQHARELRRRARARRRT